MKPGSRSENVVSGLIKKPTKGRIPVSTDACYKSSEKVKTAGAGAHMGK